MRQDLSNLVNQEHINLSFLLALCLILLYGERLVDMLNKIEKALGDYLEKQRAQFARFYFIGDADLLEIIGNSRDIDAVGHHLGKMFAGLAKLR